MHTWCLSRKAIPGNSALKQKAEDCLKMKNPFEQPQQATYMSSVGPTPPPRATELHYTSSGGGTMMMMGGGGTMMSTMATSPTIGLHGEKLHQIVVFELREDGTTEYSTMTLRALYNYVVRTITEACREANLERHNHNHHHNHNHLHNRNGHEKKNHEQGSVNVQGHGHSNLNQSRGRQQQQQQQQSHHIHFHGQSVSSRAIFESKESMMNDDDDADNNGGINVIQEEEEGENILNNNNGQDNNTSTISESNATDCNTPTTPASPPYPHATTTPHSSNIIPPHLPSLSSSTYASATTPSPSAASSEHHHQGISVSHPATHLPSLSLSTNASETPSSVNEHRRGSSFPTPIMSNQSQGSENNDNSSPYEDCGNQCASLKSQQQQQWEQQNETQSYSHQPPPSYNRPKQQYHQQYQYQQRAAQTAFTPLPANNTHRERLGGYLHPRDMRRLVTPFSSSNEPQLMVRRHVMLLNFDPLRAVVLRDRLLVLVPDGADSILIELERRVRGGIVEMENQVFGVTSAGVGTAGVGVAGTAAANTATGYDKGKGNDSLQAQQQRGTGELSQLNDINQNQQRQQQQQQQTPTSSNHSDTTQQTTPLISTNTTEHSSSNDEWEDIQNMNWKHMPYELQSVDAVLQTVISMLMDDARKVHTRSTRAMSELRGDSSPHAKNKGTGSIGEHAQERLRLHKDEANAMENRVQGFVRAMNEVLDDDEDMTLMNLSRLLTHPERFLQPVPKEILHEESDEPELMLETYLQQALSIVNELDLLKGQIITTEEQISMTLDAVRNRLLYINTLLSVASLCVAVGSFVGSIFGMNLTNHIEEEGSAFVRVTCGVIVGMVCMWVLLSWVFYRAANIHHHNHNRRDGWWWRRQQQQHGGQYQYRRHHQHGGNTTSVGCWDWGNRKG